jgi:hypothetical protein
MPKFQLLAYKRRKSMFQEVASSEWHHVIWKKPIVISRIERRPELSMLKRSTQLYNRKKPSFQIGT